MISLWLVTIPFQLDKNLIESLQQSAVFISLWSEAVTGTITESIHKIHKGIIIFSLIIPLSSKNFLCSE